MLALPVATSAAGFLPSSLMMLLCWAFMTLTGLLLVEANLWMPVGSHVITMAGRLLGPLGKGVSWILYLFIAYFSLVAYVSGGGSLLTAGADYWFDGVISPGLGCFIFAVVFGLVLYLGMQILGEVNMVLVAGMVVAYLALVSAGTSQCHLDLLSRMGWDQMWLGTPLLLTIFSFQTMVPSLTPYLKSHSNALRLAVISGTSIALLVYLAWQWVVLGTVPVEGEGGLANAFVTGQPVTAAFRNILGAGWISTAAEFFAFFALVTSFLGIALGLFDFLADGFKVKKQGLNKVWLTLLVIIPPFLGAVGYPQMFFWALDATGGFGDAILNGIIPVMMVWVGRYKLKLHGPFRTWGGKPLLICIVLFACFAVCVELLEQLHIFSKYPDLG